ncbi:MAG: site-2 protease family protein [Candidatus Tagabacteria bacterium CG_4_10_14_0_2_um_filter_40_13]|uniref:Site-2 protease family protein n=1 Tax=Candidatus Tagabacteria bacterium CG03_land_8_20_14_0_80_41_22 TaxID=1975020 RepID=A0A2M7B8Y4_9BACT|nr:MAG: site-2 protease family protein [Candidatus Tagabacteria bacterium CG03_land_8_20_14_0_80_41_22]PIZ56118.1 MAG: site-2 protease family protein [Candidatus Tagabacteria bacterium CG_4_10_14_0_2_um_filter_40_13]
MEFIFAITILILSVILHEISHGYVAYLLGDSTAKYAGRLTLNPLSHLDIFGSVILPVFTYLTGGFIIGWAKPVPFNPYNLKNQKWGPAIVGAAGPLTNLLIVVIFGTLIRLSSTFSLLPVAFFQLASLIVFINLILAVLNLIPIPPLDGSRLLSAFLPFRWQKIQYTLERYSFIFVIIFIFFVWPHIFLPIVSFLFKLITGLTI